MLESLMWALIGIIPVLAWLCGYHFGKVDAIREVRHLMVEQRKDYEREWLRMARGEMSAARWYMGKLRDTRRTIRKLLNDNAKLRELVLALADCRNTTCDDCVRWDYPDGGCSLDGVMSELGIEVG